MNATQAMERTEWTTYSVIGFCGPVCTADAENRMAHGGVCLRQVRRVHSSQQWQMRRVNSNGGDVEIGPIIDVDYDTGMAAWRDTRTL